MPAEIRPKSVFVQIHSVLGVELNKKYVSADTEKSRKTLETVLRQITAPLCFPGTLASVAIPPSYLFSLRDQHNLSQVTVTSRRVSLFLLFRLLAKGH